MAFQNLNGRWFWRWPTKEEEGKFIQEEDQQDLPAIIQKRKEMEQWELDHPYLTPEDPYCDFDNIG